MLMVIRWGLNFYGVSLIIGLNWLLLAVTTRSVVTRFTQNNWLTILLASLLMVGIDYVIEPVAPILDFWRFEENPVPFSNYRDWFFCCSYYAICLVISAIKVIYVLLVFKLYPSFTFIFFIFSSNHSINFYFWQQIMNSFLSNYSFISWVYLPGL